MDKFYRKSRKMLDWFMDDGKPREESIVSTLKNRNRGSMTQYLPEKNEYEYDSIDYEVVKIVNTLFPDNPGDLW